ncbi:hypothetical protein M3J09_002773 [Ascochyta lentis]
MLPYALPCSDASTLSAERTGKRVSRQTCVFSADNAAQMCVHTQLGSSRTS